MDTTETDLSARQSKHPNITDALLSETAALTIPTSADLEHLHATLSGLRAELDRVVTRPCPA
ncbi:hypothetical protein [Nocardia xishanensis]|uniref:hypothetical protein n=1 Tax=Nocardia xishanensis TaxID=238964 RepID=UPI0008350D75|nr:hypothetical protein [Nocardia xishanensis]